MSIPLSSITFLYFSVNVQVPIIELFYW